VLCTRSGACYCWILELFQTENVVGRQPWFERLNDGILLMLPTQHVEQGLCNGRTSVCMSVSLINALLLSVGICSRCLSIVGCAMLRCRSSAANAGSVTLRRGLTQTAVYDVTVSVALHVSAMYRNISASLIVNCSRVHKAHSTACLTYST